MLDLAAGADSMGYVAVLMLLLAGTAFATVNAQRAIGLPVGAVVFTIAIWYVGDVAYNSLAFVPGVTSSPGEIDRAWWQVVVFLVVFLIASPLLHRAINARYRSQGSALYRLFKGDIWAPAFQRGLRKLLIASVAVWLVLVALAAVRYGSDLFRYLFPYLEGHPGPWVLVGLGGGFDTLLALANYLQLMVGAAFGMVAALSTDRRIRTIALVGVALTWPFYVFDRTRKFILVVALPGLFAWVFARLRGGMLVKLAALGAAFLLVNAWFGFIIGNRLDSAVVNALYERGFEFSAASRERHQGLNMFEELVWITRMSEDGSFVSDPGSNYFANLVNPIPRSLWPDKPMIGIDYALARGLGGADNAVGVYATLSHGIVGQGVVNFGLYLGPAFAAILASLWAVLLARIDLRGGRIGYPLLYSLGMILTFTMGRDITFIEAYPFAFAYIACAILNRRGAIAIPVERGAHGGGLGT